MSEYKDFSGELDSILANLNDYIKRTADTAIQAAIQAGFYSGQAMAGVELEDCHKNWENMPIGTARDYVTTQMMKRLNQLTNPEQLKEEG
jgi:hypothetical protein